MGNAVAKEMGGEQTTMLYRVTRYRLLMVKDGSIPTTWGSFRSLADDGLLGGSR